MTELEIPEPAGGVLAKVAPTLLKVWRPEEIALGGGTALAARWHHRISTDIDIFVSSEMFSRTAGRWDSLLADTGVLKLEGGERWIKGVFPEGDFGIATTARVLPGHESPVVDRVRGWGIALEPTAEILARKLRLHMYGNGEFVARDFYDICTAAEEEAPALQIALTVLSQDQRVELAEEIGTLGGRTPKLDRALLRVHRPEWLNALASRTAGLIGPVPEPTPKPDDSFSPGF